MPHEIRFGKKNKEEKKMLKHKKFLAMLLTLAMVLSLAACGGKKETPAETPA